MFCHASGAGVRGEGAVLRKVTAAVVVGIARLAGWAPGPPWTEIYRQGGHRAKPVQRVTSVGNLPEDSGADTFGTGTGG
jgi:hypothetical protein